MRIIEVTAVVLATVLIVAAIRFVASEADFRGPGGDDTPDVSATVQVSESPASEPMP